MLRFFKTCLLVVILALSVQGQSTSAMRTCGSLHPAAARMTHHSMHDGAAHDKSHQECDACIACCDAVAPFFPVSVLEQRNSEAVLIRPPVLVASFIAAVPERPPSIFL
jgi:hypothetical protein